MAVGPGDAWTVGDTLAHLVVAHRLYAGLVRGDESPFTGRGDFFTGGSPSSPVNARLLAEFPERRLARLAELLERETASLLQALRALPSGRSVRWHWTTVDATSFACVALLHHVGHAYDVAKALSVMR